jgi:uncharacterized protein (TIGR02246 family)
MQSLAVCVTALLIAGVGRSVGQQRTDPALNKLADAFAVAFNAKDATRVASFYAEDAIVMPPGQPMVRGRRNIDAYYVRGFQQDISNFRLSPMESASAGAHAFEAGASTLTERRGGPAGTGLVTTSGKYVVIYTRVDGQWKIAYDIFNND